MLLDLPAEIQLQVYDYVVDKFDIAVYEVSNYHNLGHISQLNSGKTFMTTILPGSDLALTCRTLHRTLSACQERAFNGDLYINCPIYFWGNGLFHRFHKKVRTLYCMNLVKDLKYMPRQFASLLSNLDRLVVADIKYDWTTLWHSWSIYQAYPKSDEMVLYEADRIFREMSHAWSWGDRSKKRKKLRKILEGTAIDIRLLEVHRVNNEFRASGYLVRQQSHVESEDVVARVLWSSTGHSSYWQEGMDRTDTTWSEVFVEHDLLPKTLKWVYVYDPVKSLGH